MEEKQASPLQTQKLIWTALFVSQFFYGGMLYFQINKMVGEPKELEAYFIPAISSLALMVFTAAILIPKLILKSERSKKKVFNEEEMIQSFQTPFILRLVLLESVSMFGFALSFMTRDMNYYIVFATISIATFLMNYPTKVKIIEAFKS